MSAENADQKKSFLTRLMETAARNKQDDASLDEYKDHPAIIADNKKFVKIAVASTVATAAVIALSWKTLSAMAPVEETSTEANPED